MTRGIAIGYTTLDRGAAAQQLKSIYQSQIWTLAAQQRPKPQGWTGTTLAECAWRPDNGCVKLGEEDSNGVSVCAKEDGRTYIYIYCRWRDGRDDRETRQPAIVAMGPCDSVHICNTTRSVTIRQASYGKTAIAGITTGDSDQATGPSPRYRIREMHRERMLHSLQSKTPRIPSYQPGTCRVAIQTLTSFD